MEILSKMRSRSGDEKQIFTPQERDTSQARWLPDKKKDQI